MALILDAVSVALGGARVVDTVSATLSPGRITAVLGPNGAGKTSLLRGLAGLIAPASGSIILDEQPVAAMTPRDRARAIGYLPQGATLHWDLRLADLVALGRHPHRSPFAAPSPADRDWVNRAIAMTGLQGFEDRPMRTLSGGEAARGHLARVIAGDPRWILADEPFASLDPAFQIDLAACLRGLAASGTGIIVVMHDLTLAARLADDALLLDRGRLVASGRAADVIAPAMLSPVFGIGFAELGGGERRALLPLDRC